MIELTIESIRVSLMNYQRVVILREKQSDRYLCIWIGPAEVLTALCDAAEYAAECVHSSP